MSQRREARKAVLQALYADEIGKGEWTHIINSQIKPKFRNERENFRFAEKLFLKVVNKREEIDEIIKEHIKNWHIDRLATIDKLVLRMAIGEFLFFEEIPTKVTMNEAIEIVKDFSTSKSGKFVNGILDSALDQLQKEDRIHKTGRGLIEESVNTQSDRK